MTLNPRRVGGFAVEAVEVNAEKTANGNEEEKTTEEDLYFHLGRETMSSNHKQGYLTAL